jgi:hypothetical protein
MFGRENVHHLPKVEYQVLQEMAKGSVHILLPILISALLLIFAFGLCYCVCTNPRALRPRSRDVEKGDSAPPAATEESPPAAETDAEGEGGTDGG